MSIPDLLAAIAAGLLSGLMAWLAAERLPGLVIRQWMQDEAAIEAEFGKLSPPGRGRRQALFMAAACTLALACGWRFGWTLGSLQALLLCAVLLTLADIDRRTRLLPDILTQPLLWAGLLVNLDHAFAPLAQAVVGAALGYALPWLAAQGLRLARGSDGMGGGDFKLMAALGAWFGAIRLIDIVLLASLSAILWMLTRGHRALPFGPFLAAAGIAALFLPSLPL
ncbi:prepilin peptidase [Bordetella avium]|uniref:prepilin peptidase n=1 Tax=Bordetella avium TaxID=521 RepID=UPI000FDBFB32|nr:A24 family peptidase [Bordetella avium]AZY47992.1 prepilin peptidase [Bordetella avium]